MELKEFRGQYYVGLSKCSDSSNEVIRNRFNIPLAQLEAVKSAGPNFRRNAQVDVGKTHIRIFSQEGCGSGSLVDKATDSWLVIHEFEPRVAEDPPCRGGHCTLNLSRLKRPPADLESKTDGRWRIQLITSEIKHLVTIAGMVHAGGNSIMVWGMFTWHFLGLLIIVEGMIDQYKSINVGFAHLKPSKAPWIACKGAFIQDNSLGKPSMVGSAKGCPTYKTFSSACLFAGYVAFEHAWDLVVRLLTRNLRPAASKDELFLCIQAIWNSLQQADIQNLFESLPLRIAALIAARGGNPKY
ncbi:transposable element Tcb1 transposase [Trichonephila clavipes]|nr:transposable element Tcb1 transposase [Trichonephila clavipes]